MRTTRIKIVIEPPVDHRHGMVRHRVCEVLAKKPRSGRQPAGYWVMGDLGKPVLVLEDEACEYPEGWD
jgi:hypothetical protein